MSEPIKPVELSLEKQLIHKDFQNKVARMTHSQAKEFCVKLHHLMLCKDQVTAEMMKQDVRGWFNG